MKNLKILLIAIGLFIQGCESEMPLFKDEDGVKSDEAVIVYSIYYHDPKVIGSILSGFSCQNLYSASIWKNSSTNIRFEAENHISTGSIGQKLIVTKIKPGRYSFSGFAVTYERPANMYINQLVEIRPYKYNESNYPFGFTINSGEVKYLGEIQAQSIQTGPDRVMFAYLIHNKFPSAKKFIEARYPSLSARLKSDILKKTSYQLEQEKQYSFKEQPTVEETQ